MRLIIKNMVCPRCITSVEQLLKANNLQANYVRLGEVELINNPGEKKLQQFANDLKNTGFELLEGQKKQQIEKIKNLLVQKVQGGDIEEHFSLGEFLSKKLNKDYTQTSRLFPEVEGITIEQYFILQKIEKVKEWLVYNELTLSEIAWKLGYSSVAHLSSQFKRITGLTPSGFKNLGVNHRKSLDKI